MLSGIVCQLPRQRQPFEVGIEDEASRMLRFYCQASVPRDVFPPTPPGPEGSNGNGLLRVQRVAGAWLNSSRSIGCARVPSSTFGLQALKIGV